MVNVERTGRRDNWPRQLHAEIHDLSLDLTEIENSSVASKLDRATGNDGAYSIDIDMIEVRFINGAVRIAAILEYKYIDFLPKALHGIATPQDILEIMGRTPGPGEPSYKSQKSALLELSRLLNCPVFVAIYDRTDAEMITKEDARNCSLFVYQIGHGFPKSSCYYSHYEWGVALHNLSVLPS